ncbi:MULTISPECIES: chloramphenicol phosphotransferase CPT family protein [Bosea]|uniref:chloramphenicol phosphotransferase CPT family protein n=1 Tax=Bosea TaxID=85413 RepID=UPI00214FE673|nr:MULTISPECIES: chloramphenicol phosphotransferase CPT family protein [Bosea]MCR4520159.1 chloramphenicol phosphotransferase CPT family protein [Bosea sp. 47.2.35]MDR6829725.1 chloramphenicol 3-O phosphotransferase [Bosea robiniae]MDR6896608.1 chloramphenicol 3-O phosphotransferase [Bosea sp. BE109]MDR7140006.1 chloramphenicol 3-O phosphotransferase [Bosea sp. BE168]MDR7176680.1 chloramphenicol 3-O phosphotransferase [Bosea sp. BE271]
MNDSSPAPGRIILLNGASSSGKSSVARAIQARIDTPFWHISIDHLRDAGVLPSARIKSGEFDWRAMREAFFLGFERSLLAYVEAGNDLIVENIMESEAWLLRLADTLAGHDVFFVGVHCALEELERRERERGDRPIGDARRDFYRIHSYCLYDAEVDAMQDRDANADAVIAAWRARLLPSAFERLRERRDGG